ncbi:uncharacterized protein LOC125179336 [Hyalella azteca]|uniref:Uncharacterized protein LOC125179336 n=1 Tax=Hyalella azteca TaxID=294128 RepID=A0A979FX62_HYAAZ|nr:uncharacterized protein LOC125179336 [Hyalella azteca]
MCEFEGQLYNLNASIGCLLCTTVGVTYGDTVVGDVFLTKIQTANGSLANQRGLCRAEGGEPLVIKTKQVRDQAVQLVKDNGTLNLSKEKFAWLSASCNDSKPYQNFVWPDGTDIHNCASHATDVQDYYFSDGPATMLVGNNVIQRSAVQRTIGYPVLCSKY